MKRVFAWKVEGIYHGKEEGSFKEDGTHDDKWAEEEGLIVGELGKRMVAQGGGRGCSDEGKESNQERIDDICMGF